MLYKTQPSPVGRFWNAFFPLADSSTCDIQLYSTKLDCFSMGVMILHVLCGSWPIPSKPTRVDPRNRKRVIVLTEVERREKYFQQVRGDHPLVGLVHGCLGQGIGKAYSVNVP